MLVLDGIVRYLVRHLDVSWGSGSDIKRGSIKGGSDFEWFSSKHVHVEGKGCEQVPESGKNFSP